MAYTTILIGNGLGRAIDNDYFQLECGIQEVWNDASKIEEHTKESIRKCIPKNRDGNDPQHPKSEEQLETLHKVVGACETLRSIQGQRSKEGRASTTWLSEHGDSFPINVQRFIAEVANYFHIKVPAWEGDYKNFIENLCSFIRANDTHIATLNYDSLLYRPLVQGEILGRYGKARMVDGFWGASGFLPDHLERKGGNQFGWYLHLHGSPLFKEENGVVTKTTEGNLAYELSNLPLLKRHVVLQHTKYKPEIISSSSLLASYWEYFGKALDESATLIILGYGGGDTHVNQKISNWISAASAWGQSPIVYVIERAESASSEAYWKGLFDQKNLLKKNLRLIKKDNILKLQFDSDFT